MTFSVFQLSGCQEVQPVTGHNGMQLCPKGRLPFPCLEDKQNEQDKWNNHEEMAPRTTGL